MKQIMLQKEIEAEIKRLQGRAKAIAQKRGTIIRGILGQMNKYEITLAEIKALLGQKRKTSAPKKNGKKRAVPIKYKGPNGETWTGRGRTPRWLVTAESAGKKREHFAV